MVEKTDFPASACLYHTKQSTVDRFAQILSETTGHLLAVYAFPQVPLGHIVCKWNFQMGRKQ